MLCTGYGSSAWFANVNNEENFRIGSVEMINTTYDTYITGSIDEVRIYNRALTPEEVTSLYNQDAP